MKEFIEVDYAAIEQRVIDNLEASDMGKDLHAETASEMFGVPASEVTPTMRQAAKSRNYLEIYHPLPRRLENKEP